MMEKNFENCSAQFDAIRATFVQRKTEPHEFEFLIKFDEVTSHIWALRQQSIFGDINVPKENYLDETEQSWMWGWIKGNQKWHAWNKLKGLSLTDAMYLFIEEVESLKCKLPKLKENWANEFLKP